MPGTVENWQPSTVAHQWRSRRAPSRVLAIRLQAMGDVVITLPYLRALQRSLPNTQIDFVTRQEDTELPRAVDLFRRVHGLGGGRGERGQLLSLFALVPQLLARRYDVVLDLQNNRVTRAIRRMIAPRAWSAFDRFSPISAGERTRRTIEAAGFPLPTVEAGLPLKQHGLGVDALHRAGWDEKRELVVLSPAGAFPSRNWPIESYVQFARLWGERRPAQFAVLGLQRLREKGDALRASVGDALINLAGLTTPSEALAIVQRAVLVLSEDCGLMHMAWTSGIPTLALFGSSPHVWATPLGAHSLCLHSGDLPCGACMDATCRFGDVHCLARYAPGYVVKRAEQLVAGMSPTPMILPQDPDRQLGAMPRLQY